MKKQYHAPKSRRCCSLVFLRKAGWAALFFFFLTASGRGTVEAIQAEKVEQIYGSEYFSELKNRIAAAKESVFVVMPHITFAAKDRNSKVTQLLQELVAANRRGVFVFVLMNLDRPSPKAALAPEPDNREAFFFLNDNGIDVHYEDIAGDLALKFVVIDKKDVLLGSTGWTDASLESVFELNFLFSSASFAAEKIELIRKFDFFQNPFQADYYNQLYLSQIFVQHPNGLRAFFERNDQQVLKFYLYLLRKHAKESQPEYLVVKPLEAAEAMGYRENNIKDSDLFKIRGMVERLQETYVLLEFEQMNAEGDYRIRLFEVGTADSLKLPFCKGLRISDAFFEAGWQDNLSLAAQYVYFYLLSIETNTGYGSWFFVTQNPQNRLAVITQDVYVKAVRELREANLISVEYRQNQETMDFNYFDFDCLIMTPYFEAWYEGEIDSLVKQYGASRVNEAIRIAREFLKAKDIASLRQLIVFLDDYSQRDVNEILRTVFKPMPPENPFKTIAELERLLLESRRKKQAEEAEKQVIETLDKQKAIKHQGRIVLDALTGQP